MIVTYKELFEKYALPEHKIDDDIYQVPDNLFVNTPNGEQRIEIVFKKTGKLVRVTLVDGTIIDGEHKHTVQTSKGLQYLKDADDVQVNENFVLVKSKIFSEDEMEFYDIGIPAPHLYFGIDGVLHHNTFTIMKVIAEQGLVKGKDYVKLSGKATPTEIYKTLFMYRKNGLVIFDDLDSMWGNAEATNVLKAALDTSPVREISWVSSNMINVSKMSDDEKEELFAKIDAQIEEDPSKVKYPSTFDFTGRVIFISNLKKEEFDTAIMSRSAKIGMDLTPEQILQRMRKILPTLGGTDVSMEQKEALLDALIRMHGRKEITAVTMREFVKGLDIVRSGAPNWEELLHYA